MEPVFFSLEEAMREPDPNPCRTSSPPLEAHVLAGGLGGVGAGKVVGGGATEWCFHESVDEPWLLNVPTAPVANPEASTLYPNPTAEGSRKRRHDVHEMVGAVEVIPTPPAASPVVDPVAYNAMLRRKLDAHLAAVAMLRFSRAGKGIDWEGCGDSREKGIGVRVKMCGILHTEGGDIIFTLFKYSPQEILCFPYEYSVPKILSVHLSCLTSTFGM
uniref:Uncharacterized protein n=1 Tax=Aegilops tauschii subsp. strangulata TaxID=200361 RepID=A0A452ZIP4_AEGTS